MNAFEIVTIVVSVVAILLAGSSYFQVKRVLGELGKQGPWFDRSSEIEIADRPVEDDQDPPIPKRPLRGRAP